MEKIEKRPLFNPQGDTEVAARRIIGGNTTNLNDFNNMKYQWVSGWYRQAMNNFWVPEEINMNTDVGDYPRLPYFPRQHPNSQFAKYLQLYHRQRGQSLFIHTNFPRGLAFSKLFLYARYHL